MIHRTLTICNKLGLHARASTKLVRLATRFASHIEIQFNGQTVNAKRIMDVMLLAATQGSEIELVIQGPDEQKAWQAVAELIQQGFYEDIGVDKSQ